MDIHNSKNKFKRYLFVVFFLILGIFLSNIRLKSSVIQYISPINIGAGLSKYIITLGHPYNWIDASSGTELILGDDDSTSFLFNFSFFDGSFEEIKIERKT